MLYSKKMLQVVKIAWDMLEKVENIDQVEVLWISAITGINAKLKMHKIAHSKCTKKIR